MIAEAKVTEATANVAQAQAAVERAEEELANATIKAPIRATVSPALTWKVMLRTAWMPP